MMCWPKLVWHLLPAYSNLGCTLGTCCLPRGYPVSQGSDAAPHSGVSPTAGDSCSSALQETVKFCMLCQRVELFGKLCSMHIVRLPGCLMKQHSIYQGAEQHPTRLPVTGMYHSCWLHNGRHFLLCSIQACRLTCWAGLPQGLHESCCCCCLT
ncbi:hypothetical protein COO60DRAFT_1557504 [Scenedesmus sp. NREL 46B-D3]|nr:hypothetical protein COO60DRAFT_1557504 [Scenedesmus sp. NREL 46B-D3]